MSGRAPTVMLLMPSLRVARLGVEEQDAAWACTTWCRAGACLHGEGREAVVDGHGIDVAVSGHVDVLDQCPGVSVQYVDAHDADHPDSVGPVIEGRDLRQLAQRAHLACRQPVDVGPMVEGPQLFKCERRLGSHAARREGRGQ